MPTRPQDDVNAVPPALERELSGHIFTVSAGLVGVCLTVIGLFRLFGGPARLHNWADDLLAADAFAFLTSCFLAYLALRSRMPARRYWLERLADGVFLLGLAAMVLVAGLVAYELV
jgi:hypothetical protein